MQTRENIESMYPPSPMQQGMLFHIMYDPDARVYCAQFACMLHGTLHTENFAKAWQLVVERHTILRTAFVTERVEKPLLVVLKQVHLPFHYEDWRGTTSERVAARFQTFQTQDLHRGFELARAPLMRIALLRTAEESYQFLWTYHDLLLDGWSRYLILEEVFLAYEAFCQGQTPQLKPAQPYRDYIGWLQKQDMQKAEHFWRQTLQGISAPTSLRRTAFSLERAKQARGRQSQYLSLTREVSQQLMQFGRQQRLTINTLVQGAWSLLLSLYSGRDDILFGAVVSGRPALFSERKTLVGLFTNTLPIRVQIPSSTTLVTWLQSLQQQQLERQQYEYTPLISIQGWSEIPKGQPLFEHLLIFENYPISNRLQQQAASLAIDDAETQEANHYSLTLEVKAEQTLDMQMLYDEQLFEDAFISELLDALSELLKRFSAFAHKPVSALPLLPSAQTQRLLREWNQTFADYPQEQTIHQLFEAQVERTPHARAVSHEQKHCTYANLNATANRVARSLVSRGVRNGSIIALCLERGIELLTAMLAVLKVGGAFVSLDPHHPEQRQRQILAESGASAVILAQAQASLQQASGPWLTCLYEQLDDETQAASNLLLPISARQIAYVVYTSGSTGKPKGVMISHQSKVNHLLALISELQLTARDQVGQTAPQTFDISVWQFLAILLIGGRVQILSDETVKDPFLLRTAVECEHISVLEIVPSLLQAFIDEITASKQRPDFASLRWLMPTGETLFPEVCRAWFDLYPEIPLLNAYGPAECADDVTLSPIQPAEAETLRIVPIGHPIANMQLFVLDSWQRLVPVGAIGELYIGGDGVGYGYLHSPDLTAEKFLPNPFSDRTGTRLYRTGDLVRYRADGQLEFMGRIDQQVKLRGFRIELGEIESVLLQYELVRDCVVLLREDQPGQQHLVAYITLQNGSQAGPLIQKQLRDYAQQHVPEYMLPSLFLVLESLPLTAHGKVDRAALPTPAFSLLPAQQFQPPQTPLEEVIADSWSAILGQKHIGRYDNFFESGGHSLLATQAVSRLRETFQLGSRLTLRALFEQPTVSELARYIQALQGQALAAEEIPLLPRTRSEPLPLSASQERLWFLEKWEPGSAAFHIPSAILIKGPFSQAAFRHALQAIVQRHEVLRTSFPDHDGRPIQLVHPKMDVLFCVHNVRMLPASEREQAALRYTLQESQQPFDLAQGPLFRATLVLLDDQEYLLLLTIHHIISDDWSMGILFAELSALYRQFEQPAISALPALPLQYADFALWQREMLQSSLAQEHLTYWSQKLENLPPLVLPTDRLRPTVQSFRGATQTFALPPELTEKLRALSRREGVTLFMVLFTAFQVLLYRYSAQEDFGIGTFIANRTHIEMERLIGFFVNNLVLRADLHGNPTLHTLLQRSRQTVLEAYEHQEIPFEKILEALHPDRDLSRTPFFQVMLVLMNAPMPEIEFNEVVTSHFIEQRGTRFVSELLGRSNFDLTLWMTETSQGLVGNLDYCTDLFHPSTIQHLLTHFQLILEGMVQDLQQPLMSLPILTENERRQQLHVWNAHYQRVTDATHILQFFEAHAASQPHALALRLQNQSLTYAELNRQVDQLACFLMRTGAGYGRCVGVCLERSLATIVSVLAIWKAGAIYVPLDPNLPGERLAYIVNDAQITMAIVRQQQVPLLQLLAADLRYIDYDEATIWTADTICERYPLDPAAIAYILYTSGSTGQAKGVMVTHRNLYSVFRAWHKAYDLPAIKRHLQMAHATFDVFVGDLIRALGSGAALVLCPTEMLLAPSELYALITQEQIECAEFVPVVLRQFMQYVESEDLRLDRLQLLICGSDSWYNEEYQAFRQRCGVQTRLINSYGLTEVTIDSTFFEGVVDGYDPRQIVPLGRSFSNTTLYLLDSCLQPVPVGVIGELYIGGDGVTPGYLGKPDLTAERYLPDPFSEVPGQRMYATGDLVRYTIDGQLLSVGRRDHQVKLRGFRMELREIEQIVRQYEGIKDAVVVVRTDVVAEPCLIGYAVPRADREVHVRDLLAFLRTRLPHYMVPMTVLLLEAFPLNANRKVDYPALPIPDAQRLELERAYEKPEGELEEIVAEVWGNVLGIEQVGRQDNFFELGGHSLLATQVRARLSELLQLDFPLRLLFEQRSLEALALSLEELLIEEIEEDNDLESSIIY
ncbi:MAG TPA: amino acid adenylation domain-containing protein [Ktedonobacteraceae bacterium]|nr:amino acid adenylation domain-containing protein [Ktedonobacteraceae bacterium]